MPDLEPGSGVGSRLRFDLFEAFFMSDHALIVVLVERKRPGLAVSRSDPWGSAREGRGDMVEPKATSVVGVAPRSGVGSKCRTMAHRPPVVKGMGAGEYYLSRARAHARARSINISIKE